MSAGDPVVGRPPRGTVTIAELAGCLLALLVVWFAGRVFLIAFGGLLIAVFLYSLAKWLKQTTHLPYGVALAIVVVTILSFAGLVFWLVGSRLAHQASELTEAVPSALEQIQDFLSQYHWGEWIMKQSPDWGKAIAQGNLPSRITDLAGSMIEFMTALVIMAVVGLYCAAEPALYTGGLIRLVPLQRRDRAREVLTTLVYNIRWWIMGQLFAMVCVGLITGIGIWTVGAPLALALGVLAGMLEVIPNIGPVLWVVPAMLVALPQGTTQVIHVVIVYAVTHLLESHVLIPLVQRRSVLLPPMLSILAIMLLGLLGGVLGLLVAAPMALVAMLLVKMLYVEDRLGDRNVKVPGEPKRR
jgi:predicted PurR-regulated permease PerM